MKYAVQVNRKTDVKRVKDFVRHASERHKSAIGKSDQLALKSLESSEPGKDCVEFLGINIDELLNMLSVSSRTTNKSIKLTFIVDDEVPSELFDLITFVDELLCTLKVELYKEPDLPKIDQNISIIDGILYDRDGERVGGVIYDSGKIQVELRRWDEDEEYYRFLILTIENKARFFDFGSEIKKSGHFVYDKKLRRGPNVSDLLDNDPHLLKDRELVEVLVRYNPFSLRSVPEPDRTSRLCEIAVARDGKALEDVPDALKTQKMCHRAFSQTELALLYFPRNLVTDELSIVFAKEYSSEVKNLPNPSAETYFYYIMDYPPNVGDVPTKYLTEESLLKFIEEYPDFFELIPNDAKTKSVCQRAVNLLAENSRYVPPGMI